jgi:hypothetical protein
MSVYDLIRRMPDLPNARQVSRALTSLNPERRPSDLAEGIAEIGYPRS